jgi:hypothetical protein
MNDEIIACKNFDIKAPPTVVIIARKKCCLSQSPSSHKFIFVYLSWHSSQKNMKRNLQNCKKYLDAHPKQLKSTKKIL